MKIKTVHVEYGRKFNLGDYNSAEISVSTWADLEDGDTVEDAILQLFTLCRENVLAEYGRVAPKGSGVSMTVRRRFAGEEVKP